MPSLPSDSPFNDKIPLQHSRLYFFLAQPIMNLAPCMSSNPTVRPFSTTSHVYPSHLPTLYKGGRMEKRVVTATAAVVGIGYGMAKYKEYREQQNCQDSEAQAASRREAEVMMDAYADRSSLAELEAAVKAYEAQRKN
ncbi:hypothetical protein GGS21DRAFT_530855 [Xylaria nigripes]|nr:hypothetical protein GGS21DRAFT_530855 [Xylaria nigripes]